jgi:hypothetical protein
MKSQRNARSLVLSALVMAAIGTTILSALYVGGLVGHSQIIMHPNIPATAPPGGFMLVRNATWTGCTSTPTGNSTTVTNSSTSTESCLPNGIR